MKRLWIAVALLAAMCGATLVNAYYCQQLADSLSGRLNQAQTLVEREQWDQAEELTRQVYQDWQDSHFYLHVVMRHSDTDQIYGPFNLSSNIWSSRSWTSMPQPTPTWRHRSSCWLRWSRPAWSMCCDLQFCIIYFLQIF